MATTGEHPAPTTPRQPHAFARQAAITVLVALQALVLAWFGEFALGDVLMGRAIARIAAPVIGLFYGDGARDKLLVVHLDAPSLEATGGNWPLPYRYHARVLRTLAAYQPGAVFVDFTFESTRPDDSIGELADTVCDLHRRGIPVFLAAPANDEGTPLRPELEAIRRHAGNPAGCFESVGVEQLRDDYDRLAWNYPLYSRPGTRGEQPSAALALARQADPDLADEHIEPTEQLALAWGTRASRAGLDWLAPAAHDEAHGEGHGDAAAAPRAYCQQWHASSLLPPYLRPGSFLHPHDADNRPICVFHDSLTSGNLLRRKTETDNQHLAGLVHGRTVLYGASFNAGDTVVSPVHDEIPGIYLHAMAADNLLTFGSHWKRVPEGGKAGLLHWAFLFFGFLVVTASFRLSSAAWARLRGGRPHADAPVHAEAPATQRRHPLKTLLKVVLNVGLASFAEAALGFVRFFALVLLPGALLVYIAHHVLDYGILAYAEIILFCAFAEAMELGERAEEAIHKALGEHHASHAD